LPYIAQNSLPHETVRQAVWGWASRRNRCGISRHWPKLSRKLILHGAKAGHLPAGIARNKTRREIRANVQGMAAHFPDPEQDAAEVPG